MKRLLQVCMAALILSAVPMAASAQTAIADDGRAGLLGVGAMGGMVLSGQIDRLVVGEIVERGVPALIAQPGQLRTNLLGMSFLNRLESWEVRGDKLQLRGHP